MAYWSLRVRACGADVARQRTTLQHLMTLLSAGSGSPMAYTVTGAGVGSANGRYARDGSYCGSPKWVHAEGRQWLLRVQLQAAPQPARPTTACTSGATSGDSRVSPSLWTAASANIMARGRITFPCCLWPLRLRLHI